MTRTSDTLRIKLAIIAALLALTGALLLAEWAGLPTTHEYRLRGDFRRESQFFGQYGQAASAVVVAMLVWILDPAKRKLILPFAITLLATATVAGTLKHSVGRARPLAGEAADFRGPAAERDSERESFPSGHSAAAVATSVVLASLYPRATRFFWMLAMTCAGLRYVNNAHWPSDVAAGIAVGYAVANVVWHALVARENAPFDMIEVEAHGRPSQTLQASS